MSESISLSSDLPSPSLSTPSCTVNTGNVPGPEFCVTPLVCEGEFDVVFPSNKPLIAHPENNIEPKLVFEVADNNSADRRTLNDDVL